LYFGRIGGVDSEKELAFMSLILERLEALLLFQKANPNSSKDPMLRWKQVFHRTGFDWKVTEKKLA